MMTTQINMLINGVFMAICFVVMLRLDTKSNLLKFAFLISALLAVYAVMYNISSDDIIRYGSWIGLLYCIGWVRFYFKHRFFFQFANYENGAAVVIYDNTEKGVICWCNEEASRLIGWSSDELIGKSAEDLVEDRNAPEFVQGREKVHEDLKRTGKAECVFTYKRKDNHFVKIKTILYAKFDKLGDTHSQGVLGVSIKV